VSLQTTGPLITSIGAIIVALIAGFYGWRNSGRATQSGEQRAWLNDALKEARQARADIAEAEESAKKATKASNNATDRADAAERKLRQLDASAQDLIDWIGRVMRSKDQIDPLAVNDPAVARLLVIINGGPASLSGSKLQGGTD
jgi:hypothetical protein